MNRRRLRRDALRTLDELSEQMIQRFGSGMTLGELRAAIVVQRSIYDRQPLSLTEIARRSGQPKQSISRWAARVPWLTLKQKPDDGRSKLLDCDDPERLVAYVDELVCTMARLIENHQTDVSELSLKLGARAPGSASGGPKRAG
jgi:hypothetical protein